VNGPFYDAATGSVTGSYLFQFMIVLGTRNQMLWNTTAYRKMITLSIDVQGKPENNH
jgi:Ca2+/Na+ antiporter